jgi:hypothetical protein
MKLFKVANVPIGEYPVYIFTDRGVCLLWYVAYFKEGF